MKKRISTAFAIACMMLLSGVLTACGGGEIKVTLSTENSVTTLKPGESTQIIMDVENEDIVLAISDGEEYATLSSDGVLTIKADAVAGEEVTTVAKLDNKVVSNELKITVGAITLTSLTASANKTEILPGGTATLAYTATPVNTNENIEWKIIEGSTIAMMSENILIVNDNAPVGSIIKVKAQADTMGSNELTFTVGQSSTATLFITADDEYEADAGSSTAKSINIKVWNTNGQVVINEEIEYTLISGASNLTLEQDGGYSCGLNVNGHGTSVVRATIAGTSVYKDITVNCIKAPDQILAPEALVDKVSVLSTGFGADNAISNFQFQPTGTNVCTDMEYTFEKYGTSSYATTEDVTLENGVLTFASTGKYRVTATSTSGSVSEKSRSIEFDVNTGVNVSTFEDFRSTLMSDDYTGYPVNIINMEETGNSGDFNLIPSIILNGNEVEDSYTDIQILIAGKNTTVNGVDDGYAPSTLANIQGNGFTIDLSGMKYFENNKGYDYANFIKFTHNENLSGYDINNGDDADTVASKKRNLTNVDYSVIMKNLSIKGNVNIAGDIGDHAFDPATSLKPESITPSSTFYRAISLGADNSMSAFYVEIDNVKISNFNVGMRICHAANYGNIQSKVSNTTIDQCFSNGIETAACKIIFENMTYGQCGATGIELTPDHSNKAGLNFSENQQIVFAGTITYTNTILGNSQYFQLFAEGNDNVSIPMIMQGAAAVALSGKGYDTNKQAEILSNIKNSNGEFILMALVFNSGEGNFSQVTYNMSNIGDSNGVVTFGDLTGVNTTNEYILLPLVLGSDAGQNLGMALMYNMNMYNANN